MPGICVKTKITLIEKYRNAITGIGVALLQNGLIPIKHIHLSPKDRSLRIGSVVSICFAGDTPRQDEITALTIEETGMRLPLY